ncbi:MAG: hypothetical protein CFE21_08580 [Bacteroidetes bacterium B1(2017)]|nr:MAG: hypothetical protein CFE21_08580 [Bacteroidetes bacterium B1(2017)]
MKKLNLMLIAFTLLAGTACKKDKTDDSTPSTPSTSTCLITKDVSDDGSHSEFTYNSSNQLTAYSSFTAADTSTNNLTYTYAGNKVTVTTVGGDLPITQTHYLNSKGFADSTIISFAGLFNLTMLYTYNAAGELTEQAVSGDFMGSPIEQSITYEYTAGNKTKETTDDGTNTTVTTYEYYTDKANAGAKSEQALSFTPASKNMLKKTTNDDGTYTDVSYEFDADGKPIKSTEIDNTSTIVKHTFTWSCK